MKLVAGKTQSSSSEPPGADNSKVSPYWLYDALVSILVIAPTEITFTNPAG